jgi:hypothetical protein
MTRQAHDQFAKEYLAELLAPLGDVETSRDVSSEVRAGGCLICANILAIPRAAASLGLLGKMAATACLLEPFQQCA